MKQILIILIFLFPQFKIFSQIKAGIKETNNLFFIEVEPSFDEIDCNDIYIDSTVWFCEFFILKKNDTIRHTIIINPKADTINASKINVENLLLNKGEIFIKLINNNSEYKGFVKYQYFSTVTDFINKTSYSKNYTNYPSKYIHFSTGYKNDLKVDDYTCDFTINVKDKIISKSFIIPKEKNKENIPYWYDENTGTGRYNGHKLYTGSRGGIFYVKNGEKVYVTSFFK